MQAGLVFMLDGEYMCALAGLSAHNEKSWYKRNLRQEGFFLADFNFLAQCRTSRPAIES